MTRQRWLDGTLYRPEFEQDSCGFGLIANMDDKPSHWLVKTAIGSLAQLTHRGAVAADGLGHEAAVVVPVVARNPVVIAAGIRQGRRGACCWH